MGGYYVFALFDCVEVLIIAKDKNEMLINNAINVEELMVIGPNGEQMGTKKLEDALTLANYAGLDLVLMSGNSDHPVGKIMDYNKYRYEKQKKQKEAQKKQRESNKEIKEYRLSPTIDIHDFNARKKNASEYLIKGHKIKVSIKFKGRQMSHPEIGKEVMLRFAKELDSCSTIESQPRLDGRTMIMILAPKK